MSCGFSRHVDIHQRRKRGVGILRRCVRACMHILASNALAFNFTPGIWRERVMGGYFAFLKHNLPTKKQQVRK